MSFNLSGFDASQVKPSGGGKDTVPTGDYRVMAVGNEAVTTKGGEALKIQWIVTEGDHEGKMLESFLNLKNNNEVAQRIAQEELSAICHATGVMNPTNADEFHNIPVVLRVEFFPVGSAITSGSKKGQLREYPENNIRKYSKGDTPLVANVAQAAQAPQQAVAPQQATAPGTSAPPWAQKNAA